MFKEKGQLKFHNIFKPFLSLLQQNNSFFFQIGLGGGEAGGGGVRSKRQMFLLCDYGLVITWVANFLVHFVSLDMFHAEARVKVSYSNSISQC